MTPRRRVPADPKGPPPEGYVEVATYTGAVAHLLLAPLDLPSLQTSVCGRIPNLPWEWIDDPGYRLSGGRTLPGLDRCKKCLAYLREDAT